MTENKGWNWDAVTKDFWNKPSEDVYYYLERWKMMSLSNFLDLGCGIGRHSIFFAINGFEVTGYDIAESGLKVLKEKAGAVNAKVNTIRGDIENLPFEDKSFNSILAYHSIYHADSTKINKIISEMHRVLSDKGEIYLSFISKTHPSFSNDKFKKIDDNTVMKPEEDGTILPHFYVDYNDIMNLLSDFKVLNVRHIEDFYENKSSWHYFVHAAKK